MQPEKLIYFLPVLLLIVLILTAALFIYNKKNKKLREALKKSNDERAALCKTLIANSEEFKHQVDELAVTQESFEESEERYKLAIDAANDAILDMDIKKGSIYFSQRWLDLTGYDPVELEGMENLHEIILPENIKSEFKQHRKNKTPYFSSEHRMKLKSGSYKWFLVRGKCLFDNKGDIYRMAASYTDIDQLKNTQEMLHNLAYYDTLTGLSNRTSLYEELSEILSSPSKYKGALMFIDIDNFKLVNDVMGHAFGDQFIGKIGERMSSILIPNSKLFRIGGDEFIIYINEYKDFEELDIFANSVVNAFKEPISILDSRINTSISMGISLYPDDGTDIDTLLRNADIAMYKAKYSLKGKYVFYNTQMHKPVVERVETEKALRTAMENNEFLMYYQPKVNIVTGRIAGFEALVRWNSPELGIVSPSRFIEIAEKSQLIIPLGEWVLKNTCKFVKKLHDMGYDNNKVSINVSILQLIQDDFVDMVIKILEDLKLPPGSIELEITESILMESFEVINKKLDTLRNRGIRIALDDFGKGYSSLSYLKQLPITTLKIDKSFIDGISGDKDSESFIDSIVNMGHKISLLVVAEGVENSAQLRYLQECMCDEFQGFLFSKPLPEDEVLSILRKNAVSL